MWIRDVITGSNRGKMGSGAGDLSAPWGKIVIRGDQANKDNCRLKGEAEGIAGTGVTPMNSPSLNWLGRGGKSAPRVKQRLASRDLRKGRED